MPYHTDSYPNNVWQPRLDCPFCGSKNLRIGCQYADCDSCNDVEMSQCNSCHCAWGGANYWKPLSKPAVGLDGTIGELSFAELVMENLGGALSEK